MNGLLLVDKPEGWTSFDVVNYVRRLIATTENVRPKSLRVGHSGTLDPFATGLLLLLIGKDFTKRASEFSKLDKTYQATLKLGFTSSTDDPEGEITAVSPKQPTIAQVKSVLNRYQGEIDQTPPAFSAIKINGQRAYKLARAGQDPQLKSRKVVVHSLKLISYNYPRVTLSCRVSSGTYIRSLVKDIGRDLDTGAYTTELRRTMVGDFVVEAAKVPAVLNYSSIEHLIIRGQS